ncbi:uncharacterized protein LOC108475230 [Gossypium arboreum]|uniref:uncharacterized protein LOC108475230 n=1 Tax=Gossypium arboreum TaxID=29729 RepID=UPI00081972B9|nr:uncharacterized protein LOC108475230 [Gossypium arboreum]
MDWLVEHRVGLDYATKRVALRTVKDKEVVMISKRRDYLSNVISTLMAEKLVQKMCEAYMAFVSVSFLGDSTVGDIKKVKDFLDFFPEELPSLSQNREVGIELLSGTTLVSIAPYCMALKELTELKAQLQELLDCGFICPCVSP